MHVRGGITGLRGVVMSYGVLRCGIGEIGGLYFWNGGWGMGSGEQLRRGHFSLWGVLFAFT